MQAAAEAGQLLEWEGGAKQEGVLLLELLKHVRAELLFLDAASTFRVELGGGVEVRVKVTLCVIILQSIKNTSIQAKVEVNLRS